MSDADTAYAKAQKMIAAVASNGISHLMLSGEEFDFLDRLPPEISQLQGLKTLDLSNTEIADLLPLVDLTTLQKLSLDNTRITDLAPISQLASLEFLILNDTQIGDLAPLEILTGLLRLSLNGTQITDFTPLVGLTALQTLHLNHTRITDLTPLAGLKALQTLHLDETRVTDLTPLTGLVSLLTLHLGSAQVIDLAPLAGVTTLENLYLSHNKITDLTPLTGLTALQTLHLALNPIADLAPLAGLVDLQELSLVGTPITDIAPLAGLTALHLLDLDYSNISDLRPIAALDKLTIGRNSGLFFESTPASKLDTRLVELAQLNNDKKRTRETLDYLRTLPPWPEPYTPASSPDEVPPQPVENVPNPPDQDAALPLIWGKNGFDFFANSIKTDPVTEAALADLRDLLSDLTRKGNQHDDLYRIAAELQDRSAGAISDLHMVKLHLSYQKLRRLHQGRAARQVTFDDETVSTIEAVFDVLPGVTLADGGVKVLIERQEAERATELPATQDDAAMRLLQDMQHPDAPFTPEVKDIAAELLRPGVNDRLAGTRQILSRNVVVSVFKFVGGAMAAGAIGGPVGNFIYENGDHLLAYAATMGNDALFWAQSVMAKFRVEYELALGITREVAGATTTRKPPPNS